MVSLIQGCFNRRDVLYRDLERIPSIHYTRTLCLSGADQMTILPSARPPLSVRCRGRVSPAQERTRLSRLEAAQQVYNACLGAARRRVRLVRESKAFQKARTLSRDDPERKGLFREARAQHAFSDYALQAP